MISPKKAAKSLRGDSDPDDPVEDLRRFFWKLNKIFRFLLPWRCKKELLMATCLKEATFEQELKIFNESEQDDLIEKNWLSKKAKDQVWYQNRCIRELLLPSMGTLTSEQFSILVHNEEWESVQQYLNRKTPSEKMLGILLKEALKKQEKKNQALNLLCNYTRIYSLPANLVNKLFNMQDVDQNVIEKIKSAQKSYGQRQVILYGQQNFKTWEKFCKSLDDKQDVFPENQKLMTRQQYLAYNKAGKKLCLSAIIHFLSKGELSMAEEVIRYEIIGNKISNDRIDCLISGNPKLVEILWRLLP